MSDYCVDISRIGFMLIKADGHYNMVEDFGCSGEDIEMPDGEGVEAPREK